MDVNTQMSPLLLMPQTCFAIHVVIELVALAELKIVTIQFLADLTGRRISIDMATESVEFACLSPPPSIPFNGAKVSLTTTTSNQNAPNSTQLYSFPSDTQDNSTECEGVTVNEVQIMDNAGANDKCSILDSPSLLYLAPNFRDLSDCNSYLRLPLLTHIYLLETLPLQVKFKMTLLLHRPILLFHLVQVWSP